MEYNFWWSHTFMNTKIGAYSMAGAVVVLQTNLPQRCACCHVDLPAWATELKVTMWASSPRLNLTTYINVTVQTMEIKKTLIGREE